MIKQLLVTLFCLLVLTACGSKNDPSRINDFTPLTSMQIVVRSSIANGTSTPVTVIGDFSGQFSRDITSEVTLTSSTPACADFGLSGLPATRIKGVAAGTTTITAASTRWGITTSAPLTVTSATISSLAITPANPSVPKGATVQLAVTGTFSDNSTQDLTVDATWASGDVTVATISDVLATKGLVTGINNGTASLTANITATFGSISDTTTVTVTNPVPVSIDITPANPTLLSITTTQFTATATYSDNSKSDITSLATWSSSAPSFATVDNGTTSPGKAFALSSGTTQVKAAFAGITGTTNLKVTGGSLTSIAITPTSPMTLIKGNFLRMTAIGSFSNGTTRDITRTLNWTSSNTNQVRLSGPAVSEPNGNLLWVDGYTTTTTPVTVSASFGASTTNTSVSVIAPTLIPNSLIITPASADLTVGVSTRFKLTGTFNDGTVQDLTNVSTWTTTALPSLLSVGDSGLAKGKVKGLADSRTPVTISATYSGQPEVKATINTITGRTLNLLTATGLTTNLTAGNQINTVITATYLDGKTEVVTEDSTITISDQKIAFEIDESALPGSIVGLDIGAVTFSAGFESKTLTQTINVQ